MGLKLALRAALLAGAAIMMLVGLMPASVDAQSPTPDPRIDPTNPLGLAFGPGPAVPNSGAFPDLTGVAVLTWQEAVSRRPAAAATLPASYANYELQNASAQVASDGRFSTSFDYGDRVSKVIRIRSYTKTGDFLFRAPANSPVTDVRHTTIGGLPALTMFPSENVANREAAPRQLWFVKDGIIHFIEYQGFREDAEALTIAADVANNLRTVPGAPTTGSGLAAQHSPGHRWWAGAGLAAVLAAIFGVAWSQRRQRIR